MNWILSHLDELADLATILAGISATVGVIFAIVTIIIGHRSLQLLVDLRKKDALKNAYIMAIERVDRFAGFIQEWNVEGLKIKKTITSQNVKIEIDMKGKRIVRKVIDKKKKISKADLEEIFPVVVRFSNQLESFAMPFQCGAASREIAFLPISKVYCDCVEELVKFFPYFTNRGTYPNMLGLYANWKILIMKNKAQENMIEATDNYKDFPDIKLDNKDFI